MPNTGNNTPATPDSKRVEELAAMLARAHARRTAAEEEIQQAKAELQEALGASFTEGTQIKTAEGVVTACIRRAGRRFDPMKAANALPQAVIDQISTMQIDSKVAKVKLPKEVYEACLSTGSLAIVVK